MILILQINEHEEVYILEDDFPLGGAVGRHQPEINFRSTTEGVEIPALKKIT